MKMDLDHIPEEKNHPELREAILEVLYYEEEPMSSVDLLKSMKPGIDRDTVSEAKRREAEDKVRRSKSALRILKYVEHRRDGFQITDAGLEYARAHFET